MRTKFPFSRHFFAAIGTYGLGRFFLYRWQFFLHIDFFLLVVQTYIIFIFLCERNLTLLRIRNGVRIKEYFDTVP